MSTTHNNPTTAKTNIVRPYGPGKFDTILDSYVYPVSLDGGCDKECGSVDEDGRWYGMIRGRWPKMHSTQDQDESLNDTERAELESCLGVILTEDSQGFVKVEYFDKIEDLNSRWAWIFLGGI